MSLTSILSGVSKTYLYSTLARDVTRFVRHNLSDIQLDRSYWLHKAGVTQYRPVRSAIGGVSVFVIGALAGSALALALAPKVGEEFRADVKEKAMGLINKTNVPAGRETHATA